MIVKKQGGMTEFIPSPQEKREALVRDYSFNLLENLHHRLGRLEEKIGLPLDEAEICTVFLEKVKSDELQIKEIHTKLIAEAT